MKIFAIDPGTTESAYCIMQDYRPVEFGKIWNYSLKQLLKRRTETEYFDRTVIEMVASYGMAVGKEVFETCVWIGRFSEASNVSVDYIYRMDEKMGICHSSKANDSTIRQALIDRFATHDFKNGKGTKADPDYFYGFAKDTWAAFAVGVTWIDKQKGQEDDT